MIDSQGFCNINLPSRNQAEVLNKPVPHVLRRICGSVYVKGMEYFSVAGDQRALNTCMIKCQYLYHISSLGNSCSKNERICELEMPKFLAEGVHALHEVPYY